MSCTVLNMPTSPTEHSPDKRLNAFGQRLYALRNDAGLKQSVVAERAGIDRGFLGSVERGERNISVLKALALADALDVDVAELFTDLSR